MKNPEEVVKTTNDIASELLKTWADLTSYQALDIATKILRNKKQSKISSVLESMLKLAKEQN